MSKIFVKHSPLFDVFKKCAFQKQPDDSEVSGGQIVSLKICVQKFEYVAAQEHSQGS